MANSFKDISDGAVEAISKIQEKLELLEASLENVTNLATTLKNTVKGGFTKPSEQNDIVKKQGDQIKQLNKELLEQKKLIKDITHLQKGSTGASSAENAVFKSKIPTLRQLTKFKEAENKATQKLIQSEKELATTKEKVKQVLIEQTKSIGKQTEAQRQLSQWYGKLEADSKQLTTQLQREKAARDKNISKSMTGRMVESVNAIGKPSDEMNQLNNWYRQLEKESDKAAQATKKLSGAYVDLLKRQKEALNNLRNLRVEQGRNSKETRKAEREYKRLTAQINKANAATTSLASRGIGSLVRGFKNLLGAFGIIGGVYLFADFIRGTIETMKELDKLNYTLSQVIKNEGELARTRLFLNEITLKFGADLLKTSERYVKFYVAARQAGLETQKIENIFGSFTEVSALLGLKTDELTGIFLALEQMLSKGKVTTEELRRQLGERLPGAFDLMAKALNVTTRELDDMLKKGEVLSAEALPKLTEEMRKFYSLTGEGIDTLQTATTRVTRAWQLFVEQLDKSTGVGNLWEKILNRYAESVNNVIDAMKGLEGLNREQFFGSTFRQLIDNMRPSMDEAKAQLEELRKQIRNTFVVDEQSQIEVGILKGKADAYREYIKMLTEQSEEERKALIRSIIAYKDRNDLIIDGMDLVDLEKMSLDELGDAYKKLELIQADLYKDTIPYYEELIKNNLELLNTLKTSNPEHQKQAQAIHAENAEYQKQIDLLKANKEAKEILNNALKGSVSYYENIISKLKEQQSAVSTTNKKWQEFQDEIDKTQKLIDEITGAIEKLDEVFIGFGEGTDKAKEKLNDLVLGWDSYRRGIKSSTESAKELEEALRRIAQLRFNFLTSFQNDLFSEAGFDTLNELLLLDENGKTLFEGMLEGATDLEKIGLIFTSVTEVAQESLNFLDQAQDAYFERQFARLEKEKEIALQFAGESATAREEIERQYEERRKAIQKKQAESEKKRAIFNIVINTAQAIMSVIAREGSLVQGLIVGALGAAQLAMVKATQVPEFYKGTMNAPEGWALVDERRPEIHTDKKGNIKSFGEQGANLRYLNQGDRIYKSHEDYFNKELSQVLSVNNILPFQEAMSVKSPVINVESGISKTEFINQIQGLKQVIKSKEGVEINIDKNGVQTNFKRQGAKIESLNNTLRLKRRIV